MIARVKENVHIPVCGNGDIFTADQALSKCRQARTDSVMIGRGAMGNPWIFREIKELEMGCRPEHVSYIMKKQMIIRHYRMMLEAKPERIAVREMRKHIGWYIRGLKGAAQFRAEINRCSDAATSLHLIDSFFENVSRLEDSI